MKKGELTKRQIIEAARQEFYEKGYANATMKNITKRLNAQPSWITYYFNTKDKLVEALYEDLLIKITERIKESDCCNIPNILLFHFIRIRIMYQLLLLDPNTQRFYYEIIEKGTNYRVNRAIVDSFYEEFIREYNVCITKQEFTILHKFDSAGRRDFFLEYRSGAYPELDLDDIVTLFEKIQLRAYGIDENHIESMLLASLSIYKTIDVSDIRFLI